MLKYIFQDKQVNNTFKLLFKKFGKRFYTLWPSNLEASYLSLY